MAEKGIHATAENMHFPAAVSFSVNPPYRLGGRIGTGHWVASANYGTVRDRGTQDWLLIYTAAGSGRCAFGSSVLLTQPGHVVLWPPGTRHDYRLAPGCTGWEMQWAHFVPWPHWIDMLNWPGVKGGYRHLHVENRSMRREIRKDLEEMHRFATGPYSNGEQRALNCLERALLRLNAINPATSESWFDSRIRKAVELVSSRITDPLTVERLAWECGLSPSRFAHLFRRQVGLTPMHYLEEQRLRRAKNLLDLTTFSVRAIAAQCGFESPFYFSRRFRKFMGKSPRQYREGLE